MIQNKITEIFSLLFTGFVSCSPSPCKNGGLCVSSPRGESHCKWVAHSSNHIPSFPLLQLRIGIFCCPRCRLVHIVRHACRAIARETTSSTTGGRVLQGAFILRARAPARNEIFLYYCKQRVLRLDWFSRIAR